MIHIINLSYSFLVITISSYISVLCTKHTDCKYREAIRRKPHGAKRPSAVNKWEKEV